MLAFPLGTLTGIVALGPFDALAEKTAAIDLGEQSVCTLFRGGANQTSASRSVRLHFVADELIHPEDKVVGQTFKIVRDEHNRR